MTFLTIEPGYTDSMNFLIFLFFLALAFSSVFAVRDNIGDGEVECVAASSDQNPHHDPPTVAAVPPGPPGMPFHVKATLIVGMVVFCLFAVGIVTGFLYLAVFYIIQATKR